MIKEESLRKKKFHCSSDSSKIDSCESKHSCNNESHSFHSDHDHPDCNKSQSIASE